MTPTNSHSLLAGLDSPRDLRRLSPDQLPRLAEEIRAEIIRVIRRNGGHLASSLGAVELILALHYVFQTPEDKIVFDVGHQCYAHKLITGRRGAFETIRQPGGLSGFPKRAESPYDVCDTGHSSTSVSAALGLAVARDLSGLTHQVAAVLGDGALTGGMALEALNHAGALKKKLLVVLNDNAMSIAPNVGALSSFLTRKFTTKQHLAFKRGIKSALARIPKIGRPSIRIIQKTKESLKGLLISPSSFFEALGFNYVGLIDGHDFPSLLEALENTMNLNEPVLLHVRTIKGKGYPPAEEDPCFFHGLGGTPLQSSLTKPQASNLNKTSSCSGAKKKETYTDVFGRFMVEKAEQEPKLAAITAAMAQGVGLGEFFRRFPERAFDTGIAEQHAVTYAAGLALAGHKPVVAMYSTFLQRAFDQLFHDVCLQNLPVMLAVDRAGLVGEDGPTHHGSLDLSYLRILPNLTVMAPKDEHELRDMLNFALTLPGPSAIRYPRGAIAGRPAAPNPQPLVPGRGEVMAFGDQAVIFALGSQVWPALEAAAVLAEENCPVAVVNLRFLKPLDEKLIIKLAAQSRRVLCLEENVVAGGLGSAVAEVLSRRLGPETGFIMEQLGLPVEPLEDQGPPAWLKARLGLDIDGILQAVRRLVGLPLKAAWPLKKIPA